MNQKMRDLQYAFLKAQTNYVVLREWIYTYQMGHPIKNYFLKKNYKTIAIYGVGEIGLLLCNELLQCPELEIAYAIDKNVKNIPFNIPVAATYLTDKKVDVIVVTPDFAFQEIKKSINEAGMDNVVSIRDIIIEA